MSWLWGFVALATIALLCKVVDEWEERREARRAAEIAFGAHRAAARERACQAGTWTEHDSNMAYMAYYQAIGLEEEL